MIVFFDECGFLMKSDNFIPILMKLYLTVVVVWCGVVWCDVM